MNGAIFSRKYFSQRSGFSLIELCIVTIISGLLLSAGLRAYQHYLDQRGVDVTNDRLEQIQTALSDYVQSNGYYPCPAPANAPPSDAGYAKATDCNAGAVSGVTEVTGAAGRKVRIGAVPVRMLGLADSYSADGWDHRFTYAVTVNLAQSAAHFHSDQGAITVKDTSDHIVAGDPSSNLPYAHYAVISAGLDGKGAYGLQGGLFMACNAQPGLDQTNCLHNGGTFTIDDNRNYAGGANHFDDFAAYAASVGKSCVAGQQLSYFSGSGFQCVDTSSPVFYTARLDTPVTTSSGNGFGTTYHNDTGRTVFATASACAGGGPTRDLVTAISAAPLAAGQDGNPDSIATGGGRINTSIVVPPGWYVSSYLASAPGDYGCIADLNIMRMYP